jgi:nucleotide-binding universal stress UspA family protein
LAEHVLPYVRAFAQAFDIPVELFCVDDPGEIIPYLQQGQVGEYLSVASDRYLPRSLKVDVRFESGRPAEVIVERARSEPASLIAMATHGLSAIQRWLLGSVTSKVVQSATNPLLLVRPAPVTNPADEIYLEHVVVPLDGSALAEKIFPHVIAISRKFHMEVNLARVYSTPPRSYIVGDGLYQDVLAREREAIRKEAESYLGAKTEELRAGGLERVVSMALHGDPAGEIADLASKTRNCLVVMSTHGRSGVGRWVLGSVAEKVIHHSKDPVLVVRPES